MTHKVKVSYNEKMNWLLHHQYVTKEFHQCNILAEKVDFLSKNNSEYAGRIRGLVSRVDGQVQTSLKHFQSASAINPANIDNINQVAKSFTLLAMHKQALRAYDEAEELAANDSEVAHHKALCYLNMNDSQNATRYAKKAISLKKSPKTLVLLARVQAMNGESTLEAQTEALRLCPDQADVLCDMALLCWKRGEHSNAFSHASKCIASDSKHLRGLLVLGSVLQTEGSSEVALSKYELLTARHDDSSALWNNISMCFFVRRRFIATLACLKRSLYFNPCDAAVLYNSALVHASMHLSVSAFQYVSLSLALKFKSPELLMLLAVILTNLQDIQSAEQAYIKALEMNGTDCLTLINFALFLAKRGRLPEARECLLSCKQHLRETSLCATEIEGLSSKLEKMLFDNK